MPYTCTFTWGRCPERAPGTPHHCTGIVYRTSEEAGRKHRHKCTSCEKAI